MNTLPSKFNVPGGEPVAVALPQPRPIDALEGIERAMAEGLDRACPQPGAGRREASEAVQAGEAEYASWILRLQPARP